MLEIAPFSPTPAHNSHFCQQEVHVRVALRKGNPFTAKREKKKAALPLKVTHYVLSVTVTNKYLAERFVFKKVPHCAKCYDYPTATCF